MPPKRKTGKEDPKAVPQEAAPTPDGLDGSESIWICEKCKTEFESDLCEVMECEFCDCHYCAECLNMSTTEYGLMTKRSDIHWYCNDCESKVLVSMRLDRDIAKRCADYYQALESRLAGLEEKIEQKANKKDVEQLGTQLRKELTTKADKKDIERLEAKMSEVEKSGQTEGTTLTKSSTQVTVEEVKKSVDNSVEELKDRELRKDKLVIFNIPESTDDEVENRKLFDVSQAVELINTELKISTEIKEPVRLGKRIVNSKYPRPLRITVDSEQTKWRILKSAKNLKDSGKEDIKKIYIKRDMTRLERELDDRVRKQLSEKRKDAEVKGETCQWTIRKGKLVYRRVTETVEDKE